VVLRRPLTVTRAQDEVATTIGDAKRSKSGRGFAAKTWVLKGQNSRGWYGELALRRLITSRKGQFRWRTPEENPYLIHDESRKLFESRYADVAFAFSNT
jgi:hypothetical protein